MDKLLEFRNNRALQNEVVKHLLAKKVPLNQANLFYQHETWEILAEKIYNGEYHFQPLTEGYIDKRNGNGMSYEQAAKRNFEDVRKIYMLCPMDRAVMHMIYLIYYRLYIGETSEYNVSYKSGIGISKVDKILSQRMNAEQKYNVIKLDIRHYFDEVNIETIEKCLRFMDTGDPLDKLLWEIYHDDRVTINGIDTHKYRGLIQGCAFACLLANLCLKDIDDTISSMNLIYYRYSDDIIMCGSKAETEKGLKIIQRMLKEKGLQIHPEKLHRYNGEKEWFEFLGFKFKKDNISIAEKTLDNLKHEVKLRTITRIKTWHRPATKKEICKMIEDLQSYFFTSYAKSRENFGMGVYLFGTMNNMHDLKKLDSFIKHYLRACYTGDFETCGLGSISQNDKDYAVMLGYGRRVNYNLERTIGDEFEGGDLLKECGWVSLVHMYKMYHTSKEIYESEVLRMMR